MELKIGILFPRSDMFPTLTRDFLNGLKLALKISEGDLCIPKLIIESVGNATGKSLFQAAEKMILQEDVALTISFCGIFNLKELVGIYDAYKKPLIHVDLGGNVLRKEHISPYVIHHTLNLWQSAYLSGAYAASTLGKNAALAISFYDGGYHLVESFVQGFTENGGNVVYTYVSQFDYKSESFETMINGIHNANPDFVHLLFSYKEGEKVFDLISKSSLNGKIPFLATPLMTEETAGFENFNLENVFSISTWDFDSENPQMKNFQKHYSNIYGNSPNLFALLGYEAGQTLSFCLENENKIPSKIGDFVSSLKIDSPRGKIIFNRFHETQISLNKIKHFLFNATHYKNTVVKTLDTSFREELYEKFQNFPESGWQNPYIIT